MWGVRRQADRVPDAGSGEKRAQAGRRHMDTAPTGTAAAVRRVLVSSCLLGGRVRFDGRAKTVDDAIVDRWRAERRIVAHCPEVSGGLPVPRPPAEIEPGAGA